MDELGLPAILTIEGSDRRLAETVLANTADPGRPVLTLDSMQAVTRRALEEGANYISVMESNLEVLKQALGN